MLRALEIATQAAENGEVPVGAVLIDPETGKILAESGNQVETLNDPTAHAEIMVLREAAGERGSPRLEGLDLYVTLEPCAMCASAISHARIRRVIFGAYDPKGGGIEHGARVFDRETCHHRPEVIGGVDETKCAEILKSFFKSRRTV